MRRLVLLFVALASAAGILFRCYTLFDPWIGGHNAWGGSVYGASARNYVTFGYGATLLGPIVNTGSIAAGNVEYYYHYPPLLVLLVSSGYLLFGDHEWSARLVPVLFSVLTMAAVYRFAKREFDELTAALALLFVAVMPGEIYYAAHVDVYGSVAVFFSTLAVDRYTLWLRTRQQSALWFCALATVLGCATSWYADFLALAILAHHQIVHVRPRRSGAKDLWPLVAGPIIVFALFLVHRHFLLAGERTEVMGTLSEKFLRRITFPTAITGNGKHLGPAASFIYYQLRWIHDMYTPILGALTGVWIFCFATNNLGGRRSDRDWAVFLLLAGSLLHSLAFPSLIPGHDYLVLAYTPGVALAAAIVVGRVTSGETRDRKGIVRNMAALGLVGLVILSSSWGTRILFRQDDLQAAEAAKRYGKAIGANTQPADTVLVPENETFRLEQLRYYAARRVLTVSSPEDIKSMAPGPKVLALREEAAGRFVSIGEPFAVPSGQRHSDGLVFLQLKP